MPDWVDNRRAHTNQPGYAGETLDVDALDLNCWAVFYSTVWSSQRYCVLAPGSGGDDLTWSVTAHKYALGTHASANSAKRRRLDRLVIHITVRLCLLVICTSHLHLHAH